jgi:hypothetical protein
VLCDDFDPAFPGVQQAVRECATSSSARLVFRDGQAALLSKRADAIADALVARGWMEEKISAARKRSASTGEERDVIQRLTADLRVEQQRANAALTDLYALRSSFSWRITAPLRAIRGALRRR